MTATLRTLSTAAFLIAGLTMPVAAVSAADMVGQPNVRVAPRAAVHWRGRDWHRYPWAPSELVAGVRGATPLTVPFVGYNWYPGPVYYYGPPPEDAIISVRY